MINKLSVSAHDTTFQVVYNNLCDSMMDRQSFEIPERLFSHHSQSSSLTHLLKVARGYY
jgi:hypothetical protein